MEDTKEIAQMCKDLDEYNLKVKQIRVQRAIENYREFITSGVEDFWYVRELELLIKIMEAEEFLVS